MKRTSLKYFPFLLCLLGVLLAAGCNKETRLGDGPYFKAPVTDVQFYGKKPNPVDGKAGDKVTFEVKGLDKLKNFTFYINQVEAEVVTVTDSLATVVIPAGTSSGPAAVLSSAGQYFYGPILKIEGKVSIDPTFKTGNGTNGPIYTAFYSGAGNGLFILGGSFTDYDNKSASQDINSIVKISSDGTFLTYDAGKGSLGGAISTILSSSGQYYIGGIMSTYDNFNVDGITRVNDDCSMDSSVQLLVNPDTAAFPDKTRDTVPTLNAYLSGAVMRLFEDNNHNIIAIGNFGQYSSNYYAGSQKDNFYVDRTEMYNFARINDQGKLDSAYNFDPAIAKGRRKLNGNISDAIQLPGGKIVFVGSFTKFDGNNAPKMAALTDDGNQDLAFATAIGSGADGDIYRMTYNKTTNQILVTGDFTRFNGHVANGIALLNADGTYDDGFKLKAFSEGQPNFAGQLDNGRIIVSGSFNKYDGVNRQGFMILNPDGTLADGYNNTGSFVGQINGLVETNAHAVVIYGQISLFDNVKVGNIVKIAFD